jgi:hypothetical protein
MKIHVFQDVTMCQPVQSSHYFQEAYSPNFQCPAVHKEPCQKIWVYYTANNDWGGEPVAAEVLCAEQNILCECCQVDIEQNSQSTEIRVKEPLQHMHLVQPGKSAMAKQNFNMEHHIQINKTKTLHQIPLNGLDHL